MLEHDAEVGGAGTHDGRVAWTRRATRPDPPRGRAGVVLRAEVGYTFAVLPAFPLAALPELLVCPSLGRRSSCYAARRAARASPSTRRYRFARCSTRLAADS